MEVIEIIEANQSQRDASIMYQARLKDQPDVKGEGKTVNQAIGDLVVANQDKLGFQIEFPR